MRAERVRSQQWFYNYCLRLLLERVTEFCYRHAASEHAKGRFLKIVCSERGAHSYAQTSAYQELLKMQAKGGALFLNKRRIRWEVLDWRLAEPASHKSSAGAQLADVVASAFYQAVDTLPPTKWNNELPHGTFLEMIEADLPFTARWAQKLMEVAADQRIRKASHGSLLPMAVTTLYELCKLDDEDFEQGLASGEINPDMTRDDAKRLRGSVVQYEERRVAVPIYRHEEEPEVRVVVPVYRRDADEEPVPFMASRSRTSRRSAIVEIAETPELKLVSSAMPEQPRDVTPLLLVQIDRLVDNLAGAIERGEIEKSTALQRWRLGDGRLSDVDKQTIN
jgi:hypothetical protein